VFRMSVILSIFFISIAKYGKGKSKMGKYGSIKTFRQKVVQLVIEQYSLLILVSIVALVMSEVGVHPTLLPSHARYTEYQLAVQLQKF
jgi:hypothetical protein